ncbi:MAG: glutaminase [Mangrovicoccus sp.]|nr:glutaminase [Mangrovicoccus sp.]
MDRAAVQAQISRIAARMAREKDRGQVARYIPELAQVDPQQFGIAVAPIKGEVILAGQAEQPFSVQSISKVFALTLALSRAGAGLWQRVGREPSGDPFNSIVQLEYEKGVPRNPFINAGAIVISDVLLEGRDQQAAIADYLAFLANVTGESQVAIDPAVWASERATSARNRALAQFIAAEGNLRHPVEEVLELYFQQCSLALSCAQLAKAGRYLAAGCREMGAGPVSLPVSRARRINALMMTCGCYDASGDVAYRVGLPCKSGVGGGVLAIVPGVAAIAAWCPGLDEKGNSKLALEALEDLAQSMSWSVF